jgi:hypothetical protein
MALPRPQLPAALAEFRRALAPGGVLLIAMHGATAGSPDGGLDEGDAGELVEAQAFGHPVELRVTLVHARELSRMARDAGLPDVGWRQRPPYPAEYPTQRVYLWSGLRPTCAAGCRAAG